jgi:dihydrofolate reductase
MRKLKLQVQMSVDGYIAGPNGEMDWMVWNWDQKLKDFVMDLTNSCDTIVMGRNLAGGFIPHWAAVAENAESPEQSFGQIMTDYHKVVFTKTLEQSEWANTVLAKGDLVQEIHDLKNKAGKDIIVYGGAGFVSSLIAEDLIDELHLFVNPTAIGTGLKIFNGRTNLVMEKATHYECGITVLKYSPAKK